MKYVAKYLPLSQDFAYLAVQSSHFGSMLCKVNRAGGTTVDTCLVVESLWLGLHSSP